MEKGQSFKILDHGYVTFIDSMGTDEAIIEAARMSTGRGFEGWEKDESLLDFLWRKKHSSPFEMCELQIEVQAPIFVFREWHRHRTQSYNEFSARYAQMPNLHYLPDPSRMAKQNAKNKQGSSDDLIIDRHIDSILKKFDEEQQCIYETYEYTLNQGLAKEIARVNTPVSRYSKMRAKTDLLNWLKFLNLRMRPNAQWEIRQYAFAVSEIIKSVFPRSWALFEEYDLYGVSFSRTEIRIIRDLLIKYVPGKSSSDVLGDMTRDEFIAQSAMHNLKSKSKLDDFLDKIFNGGEKIL